MTIEWLDEPPQLLGSLSDTEQARLDSLDPSIRVLAEELLRRRPELTLVSAYRSLEEQEHLYRQGRQDPGPVVTNAPPGRSWHNYGLAFDVTPPSDAAGRVGKRLSLKWGGDFDSFYDPAHFEYHPGLTLDDAAAGARPPIPTVPRPGKKARVAPFLLGMAMAWGTAEFLGLV